MENRNSNEPATPEIGPSVPARVAGPIPISRPITYFALTLIGVTADLWTKSAVFARLGLPGQSAPWWIIQDHLGFQTAVNTGALFGIGAGQGTLFASVAILAILGIITWLFWFGLAESKWLTWALGMITGGILGNLHDRLGLWWQAGYPPQWQSGVRDWILFRIEGVPLLDPWPNFNIADSLLVVGACMLMYHSIFLVPKDSST